MKRIKHSKVKNTGLIFELLVRQVASDTMNNRDSRALRIIKKHFNPKSELSKELKLYRTVSTEKFKTENKAEKFVDAVVKARKDINESQLRRDKYNLIKDLKSRIYIVFVWYGKSIKHKSRKVFYASTTPIRAVSIATSPISVNSIIVSPNDRHLIALGANEYAADATVSGTFNPMLVRWSDQDNRTNWVPSVTTTAGEVVLTDGTKIVGAVRAKNAINVWTDNSLWTMEFVGPPFTFRFQQAGTNCGLIGPHAGIDYNGVTYWMGYDNFYRNTGQVETIPCTVRRYIFNDINNSYYDKVFAGINSEFKEIIWLYCSGDSTECDKYVIFSPEEDYWVYGETIFTTFGDKEIFGNSITTGVTASGNNIYNNEPVSVFTGSGETLVSYIESGDFDVADGNAVMFMNRVIPDYDLSGGKIKMKIITKEYPESTSTVTKEFDIFNNTEKVNFRSRGRQAKVRVSCASNNASWRWGSIRLGLQGDGGR